MKTRLERLLAHKGRRVQSISAGQKVIEAVTLMNDLRIGALVVLDRSRLIGIFTERDVLMRVVAQRRDPDSTAVADVMTQPVFTLPPSATVETAMRLMLDKKCRHLPIVEGEELLGLISLRDLSNWAVREKQQELEELSGYMYRSYPN